MADAKFAFIGGGSLQWAPQLMTDIALTPGLENSHIALFDIDAGLADMQLQMGTLIGKETNSGLQVTVEQDCKQALEGADFVIFCIAQGGLDAMQADIEIPWKYGIAQSVGDTVGPGGISRALRHIPVVVDVAKDMETLCPDAWMLNLTNPMTTICRAVTKVTKIRAIGLCHEMHGVKRSLSGLFDVDYDAIRVHAAGVNHLPWILQMDIDGKDGFEMLRAWIDENGVFAKAGEDMNSDAASVFRDRLAVKFSLFEAHGALAAAGDRHLAEFFPHFLTEVNGWGSRFGVELTTIEHRREGWQRRRDFVQSLLQDGAPQTSFQRGSEQLSGVAAALKGGEEGRYIINIPNRGQIPELPADVTVESYAWVSRRGVEPIVAGPMPASVAQIVRRVSGEQELIVEAALQGDKQMVVQAMLADALVKEWSIAEPMVNDLLEAHQQYLPQF